MRNILFLSLLSFILLPSHSTFAAPQVINLVIENKSFDTNQHPQYHLLISGGEEDQTLFIPYKSRTLHTKVTIPQNGYLKVVFGTKADYPYVLGGFGFFRGSSFKDIAKMYIKLEKTQDEETSSCLLQLHNPVFYDSTDNVIGEE